MLATSVSSPNRVKSNEDRLAKTVADLGTELETSIARTTELLTRLAAATAAHSHSDKSMGILDDLLFQAPRLSGDVKVLARDHHELPSALVDLRMRSHQLEVDIQEALERLAEHQRLAQHLVFEAFDTDLGGGD